MDLKRDIVKYIRDKAKNKYKKGTECRICGEEVKLDFHHFYTLGCKEQTRPQECTLF